MMVVYPNDGRGSFMGKQIIVHSINHASYAHQLISVFPKPTYSYSEAYGGGRISWVESVATLKLFGPISATPKSR